MLTANDGVRAMKRCTPMAIGAALLLLPSNLAFRAHAGGLDALAQSAPANAEANSAKTETAPAKPEPTRLSCRAVRSDIGMYEPLRFLSVTVDIPKKYVKMVHDGDGKIFEFTGAEGSNGSRNFVKITEEAVVYGQQGRETWRIDRYTGTMTSSAFTIQFECQLRPSERKF
jgi:hypothetical protein